MSSTSNEQLPLLTGKKNHPRAVILTMENEPPRNNTSGATKILCSCLMLLYRGFTVHKFKTAQIKNNYICIKVIENKSSWFKSNNIFHISPVRWQWGILNTTYRRKSRLFPTQWSESTSTRDCNDLLHTGACKTRIQSLSTILCSVYSSRTNVCQTRV